MADSSDALVKALMDRPAVVSGGTGSWGDPPVASPGMWGTVLDYVKSLPPRAMMHFADEGRRLRDDSVKENARNTYGVGHGVDAYDAAMEGRWPAALGSAALGALDLTAPITSPAIATTDALAHAWRAGMSARPAQVAEALAQMTSKRMKSTGAAAEKRAAVAERSVPHPDLPPGANYPSEAERMLDVIDRKWPGNVAAGVGAAAGATGVPGVMLDDAKSAIEGVIDPMVGQHRTMRQEMAQEGAERAVPLRSDAEARPNIANYQHLQDEARLRRNINVAEAAGETLGGVGATYGAMKTVPWAAHRTSAGMAGLGADMMGIHPLLGLGVMAAGAAPFAVPAALGYGSWAAAHDIPEHADAALDAHKRAKLIGKLMDNYRDPTMKLVPDGDY